MLNPRLSAEPDFRFQETLAKPRHPRQVHGTLWRNPVFFLGFVGLLLLLRAEGSPNPATTRVAQVPESASPTSSPANTGPRTAAKWVIVATENKLELGSGTPEVVPQAPPDVVTLMDYTSERTRVYHLTNVTSSVLSPPSNVAIHPSGQLALISDSIRLDVENPGRWYAQRRVHVLALSRELPRVIGEIQTGWQPSGIAFSRDGRLALIANRAGGSVTVLSVRPPHVQALDHVQFAEVDDEVTDVAIHPAGHWALACVRERGYLHVLTIREGESGNPSFRFEVSATDRKVSVFGRPHQVRFTPNGQMALSIGSGWGNGGDADALTVIDASGPTPQTVDYIPLGSGPEGMDLNRDGSLCAVVLMNGSHLAPNDPFYQDHGLVVLLELTGQTYSRRQILKTAPIPTGVVFSPDGRHLLIASHGEKKLQMFPIRDQRIYDSGDHLELPGRPGGLRSLP